MNGLLRRLRKMAAAPLTVVGPDDVVIVQVHEQMTSDQLTDALKVVDSTPLKGRVLFMAGFFAAVQVKGLARDVKRGGI